MTSNLISNPSNCIESKGAAIESFVKLTKRTLLDLPIDLVGEELFERVFKESKDHGVEFGLLDLNKLLYLNTPQNNAYFLDEDTGSFRTTFLKNVIKANPLNLKSISTRHITEELCELAVDVIIDLGLPLVEVLGFIPADLMNVRLVEKILNHDPMLRNKIVYLNDEKVTALIMSEKVQHAFLKGFFKRDNLELTNFTYDFQTNAESIHCLTLEGKGTCKYLDCSDFFRSQVEVSKDNETIHQVLFDSDYRVLNRQSSKDEVKTVLSSFLTKILTLEFEHASKNRGDLFKLQLLLKAALSENVIQMILKGEKATTFECWVNEQMGNKALNIGFNSLYEMCLNAKPVFLKRFLDIDISELAFFVTLLSELLSIEFEFMDDVECKIQLKLTSMNINTLDTRYQRFKKAKTAQFSKIK